MPAAVGRALRFPPRYFFLAAGFFAAGFFAGMIPTSTVLGAYGRMPRPRETRMVRLPFRTRARGCFAARQPWFSGMKREAEGLEFAVEAQNPVW